MRQLKELWRWWKRTIKVVEFPTASKVSRMSGIYSMNNGNDLWVIFVVKIKIKRLKNLSKNALLTSVQLTSEHTTYYNCTYNIIYYYTSCDEFAISTELAEAMRLHRLNRWNDKHYYFISDIISSGTELCRNADSSGLRACCAPLSLSTVSSYTVHYNGIQSCMYLVLDCHHVIFKGKSTIVSYCSNEHFDAY